MKKAPVLTVMGKELSIPLIQGGMGVGVSLERLAGSVAAVSYTHLEKSG